MAITIFALGEQQTVRLAAEELAHYLHRVSGEACAVETRDAYDPVHPGFWVGTCEHFPDVRLPEVADTRLDDAYAICCAGTEGRIVGINPRSVLLAVYRYLRELGCRWVRPGADGEYLPTVALDSCAITLTDAAAYRHRALDIAGAISLEWALETIAWGPKIGLSGFFLEFDDCYGVCSGWYNHERNPFRQPDGVTREDMRPWRDRMLQEIKRRDLIFHSKGHGWVYETLGYRPEAFRDPLPPEDAQYLAQINGVRAVHGGAGGTNLCYGNPEVRRRYAETVVRYARQHPEVDYVHVWLADGTNNHCECERCQPYRPADLYLHLLNEIDEALTAAGLPVRIVFLIYVDLLWPPEQTCIVNQERFTLMFAPIHRVYTTSFAEVADHAELPALPPYQRNALVFSRGVPENVAFLEHWRRIPHGDAFDFDYHYWLAQFDDPSEMHLARVLHGDIQRLQQMGLDGLVGCFSLRSFYPSGLGMAVMGRTLWAKGTPFDTLVDEHFQAAYGPDWQRCRDYLHRLSTLIDPRYLNSEKPVISPADAETLAEAVRVIAAFQPVIARNRSLDTPCWAASWRYLALHSELTALFCRALAARARGEGAECARLLDEVNTRAFRHEEVLFPVLETRLFSIYLEERADPVRTLGAVLQ